MSIPALVALALGLCSVGAWIGVLLHPDRPWLLRPVAEDEPEPAEPAVWPSVRIVVPARNEAAYLPSTLPALVAQDYPGRWELVVVDDRSSDETAEAARTLGVEVVHGTPLPIGWVGKVWAVEQGARGAETEYLLLTDADIRHVPGSLRRLVAEAEALGLVLVSRMARLSCSSRAERLLIPPFLLFFNLLYPMRRANRGRRPAAAGGCLLVRRAALENAGGFAAIRAAVIDDLNLARLVGGPLRLALSRSRVVSLHRHDRVRDVWRMVARTAFAELRYSWLRVAAATAAMLLLFALPPVLTAAGVALASWPVAAAGAAAWGLQATIFLPALRFFGLPARRAPTLPVAGVLYAAITVDSAIRGRLSLTDWSVNGGFSLAVTEKVDVGVTSQATASGVSFELTDEQKALRELAHEFAEREIRPRAAEYDEHSTHPADVIAKAHEVGLMNPHVPVELGGLGLGVFDGILIGEELSWGCSGIAVSIVANTLGSAPVMIAGTDEQKREWLPPLIDEPLLCSFALTEPNAGSDVSGIQTTAVRHGDEYVVNGSKMFITNAGHAGWAVVFASTDRSKGHRGLSAFIVPMDTAGVVVEKHLDKMGQRATDTSAIAFQDVVVPAGNLLGEVGDGFKVAMTTLDFTRPGTAAGAVGVARAAYEYALQYGRERIQFGQPIAMNQGVSFLVADMAAEIEAARLLAWQAAWLLDRGERSTLQSSFAKRFAADTAMKVTTDAVQVFGGYGYIKEYPVEKLKRDAKLFQIYEGTSQIQRLVIAREIFLPRD